MQLIDENYQPIELMIDGSHERDLTKHYFEYNPEKNDIFLTRSGPMWYKTPKMTWYQITIGQRTVRLPEHFHVMVGDVLTDEVDWVQVDEMFNRQLPTFVYNIDLSPSTWIQEDAFCTDVLPQEYMCQLPFTKNILPICLGNDKAILVAEKDMYSKTRHLSFPQFF